MEFPQHGALSHGEGEGDEEDFDEVVVKGIERLHGDHGREKSGYWLRRAGI